MEQLLSTEAAARRLGLSRRQVTNLVRDGALAAVARDALVETSVARYAASRHRGASRRVWAQATAWQALALLSGVEVRLIGQSQRSRVKAQLREMDAERLVRAVRNRARTVRCVGHLSMAGRISSELIDVSADDAALGLAVKATRVDGYASSANAERVMRKFHLRIDAAADDAALLRVVEDVDIAHVREIVEASTVVAAVGLAESVDVRERTVGLERLDSALRDSLLIGVTKRSHA